MQSKQDERSHRDQHRYCQPDWSAVQTDQKRPREFVMWPVAHEADQLVEGKMK